MSEYGDDDCEDQGMAPTKYCVRFECQSRMGEVRPMLVKTGRYWRCAICGDSYGENPHPDLR